MTLDDLCGVFDRSCFPGIHECEHPARDSVLAAKSAVEKAVVDDDFLADCLARELRLIETNCPRRGLTPFHTMSDLGVQFAFGYWPPGGSPGPHEHTAWTITAVCRNELEVMTYNRDAWYRRQELIKKSCFPAPAGRVGFIYEPCIHQPRNVSREWSLSLHVISPRDGQRPADYTEGLLPVGIRPHSTEENAEHPYAQVRAMRQRYMFVGYISRILQSLVNAQSAELLARCYALGSSSTREAICRRTSEFRSDNSAESTRLLARVHDRLVLQHRRLGDMVAVYAETSNGPIEEMRMSDVAAPAIEFAVKQSLFEVRALPGDLSDVERNEIASALEETGLFVRVLR